MFADRAKIWIRSGKGGDGHCSFRRELYVANGGPDGGDGGRGGDLIFEVDEGLNTLVDYRHKRKYAAGDGEEGGKRRCHGKDGKDLVLEVPEGTVIKESKSGMAGNCRYVGRKPPSGRIKGRTRRSRKPAFCDGDDAGAEVCAAGTAGDGTGSFSGAESDRGRRSDWISECRKINAPFPCDKYTTEDCNYHFTTLNPNLGVVGLD